MLRLIISLVLTGSILLSNGCVQRTSGVSTATCVYRPDVTSDYSGGAFVAYEIRNASNTREMYVQRVSPEGDLLWEEKGILIDGIYGYGCDEMLRIMNGGSDGVLIAWRTTYSTGDPVRPVIGVIKVNTQGKILWQKEITSFDRVVPMISDGTGGVIIARGDYSSGYLHIQKIDAEGTFLWGEDGVFIHCEGNEYNSLELASDGSGGAIVTWWESHYKTESRIFVQRVDFDGRLCWGQDGILLHTTQKYVNGQQIRITSDGSGGVFATWPQSNWDYWNWPNSYDICVQRLNANGDILWQSEDNPVFIWSESVLAGYPIPVSDGSGGVIVFWESSGTIYAQRLNSNTETLWNKQGIKVWQGGAIDRFAYKAETDGSGGALITWYYIGRMSADKGEILRAQRLDDSGRLMWQTGGVPVATGVNENCNYATISQDGLGGALISWGTGRDVYTIEEPYLQRIDNKGNPLWGVEGVRLNP